MPDHLTAMQIAFGLCALGAAGGVLISGLQLVGAGRITVPLGRLHGIAGLLGMALLFAINLRGEATTPGAAWAGLVVLVLGALGGLVLLRTLFDGRPPLWLALGHGAVGVAGLWLLWPLVQG
ncbi:MAG: hypothetical protein QM656_02270 [Paracoccaceae bacterium]